jgi:TPR repeat protein
MYYLGQGVAKDNAEAALWFKKAADQGIADAQYNLGVLHYQGTGVKQDYAEAFRLYSLSAEKGYALAQYNLGLMYLQGAGVPKDPVRAYIWLDLASGHKIPGAVKSLDYLGKTMTPEQLAEAKELMGDWKPK